MALIDSETLKRKIMLLPYFLGYKYDRRKMNSGDFYAGFLNGLYATTTLIGLEPEVARSWIPIKMREATKEEKEKFNCEFAYDCPVPEDSDIVLITDSGGTELLKTKEKAFWVPVIWFIVNDDNSLNSNRQSYGSII